jgi:hypothetical protein
MAYFIFDNETNARASSELRWNQVLGRAKKPEDVTQFAWPVLVGLDGRAATDASQFPSALPPQPRTGFIGPAATLDPVNWPPPTTPTP